MVPYETHYIAMQFEGRIESRVNAHCDTHTHSLTPPSLSLPPEPSRCTTSRKVVTGEIGGFRWPTSQRAPAVAADNSRAPYTHVTEFLPFNKQQINITATCVLYDSHFHNHVDQCLFMCVCVL